MQKTISIGIHVHAEPARLQATLHSLRHNTNLPFDIILLPDGPDDATKALLNTLHHLPQSGTTASLGPPACFNRLATSTTTELVILLESGVLVAPNWLEPLLAALATDPRNGLAGPSTNRSWNEQGVFPRAGSTPAEVAHTAQLAASQFGHQTRTLEPLYSLGDFCYLVRREVIDTIGLADESYGLGPCWEMDYNIRAARKDFRGVWACGSYVYRAPFTAKRRLEERLRFEKSKHLYQDRFCGLRLRGEKNTYETHCRGEDCPHFAPPELIHIKLPQGPPRRPTLNATNPPHSLATTGANPTGTNLRCVDVGLVPSRPLRASASDPLTSTSDPLTSASDPQATFPLVSCIMPTHNRRAFILQALTYFERQDYPNKELIIVDDGNDQIADLVLSRPYVRYMPLTQKTSIGAKRNLACSQAQGQIIAHWDDDDWYAPHRLSHQIAPLLADQADITGLETFCFFDIPHWQAWSCSPELHKQLFVGDVHGGTLVYRRFIWERLAKYPSTSLAEDASLLRSACRQQARLLKLPHAQSFVYLRHTHNAWRFPLGTYLNPSGWQLIDPNTCIPTDDLPFYSQLQKVGAQQGSQTGSPASTTIMHPSSYGTVSPAEARPVPAFGSSPAETGLVPTFGSLPLVSCIMPTYNRPEYIVHAIRYFQRQDYPHRELLILDDGTQPVAGLIPSDPRIRYIRLAKRMILGAKRNLACQMASGTLIVHWDDDDWMAPHRLSYQVEALQSQHADLCGASNQLYYDPTHDKAWLYQSPQGRPNTPQLPIGNTLCYQKAIWASNPFPEIAIGEDTRFVWSCASKNIALVPDHTFYIGLIHPNNTSRKVPTNPYWHPHNTEEVHRLLSSDLNNYMEGILHTFSRKDFQTTTFATLPKIERK